MASWNDEQRKQKISLDKQIQGTCHWKEAMHTPGAKEGPSSRTTQANELIRREDQERLMERVVQRDNLKMALRRVEKNDGAPGIDGTLASCLRKLLATSWASTREQLLNGTYKPQAVRRVEIPKPDGGVRLLGIPTVQDRFIQQAVLQVLTPIWDPTFSTFSYGFRPGRNAHMAVRKAQEYISQGCRHVVDIDLEKFFDRVNHDILMAKVVSKIQDKRILCLIRRYLQAGVMINGCCVCTEEGTPQGGPLSPLLANIMLHELDEELEARGHNFARYADDCNIYVKSKRAAERVLGSVKAFVGKRLKLKVNDQKSAADRPWNRKFLGFSFTKAYTTIVRIAPKSIERFKDRVRVLTSRSRSQSMEARVERLSAYLNGWMGYFSIARTRTVFDGLDGWIRRRMRMCYLKQWKRPKTKWQNLKARGLSREWAARISGSRKGYWRLSKTHQMSKALGIDYWQKKGLVSLVAKYDTIWGAL